MRKNLLAAGCAEKTANLRILISHRPELAGVYRKNGVDLALSGHAHGGQWRVPALGGLYAPNQGVLPKLTSGITEFGDTSVVVSRGLGNSAFPIRIANRPEVVVVSLTNVQEA
jgi:predicted MPP superfamily phosphohydrolase